MTLWGEQGQWKPWLLHYINKTNEWFIFTCINLQNRGPHSVALKFLNKTAYCSSLLHSELRIDMITVRVQSQQLSRHYPICCYERAVLDQCFIFLLWQIRVGISPHHQNFSLFPHSWLLSRLDVCLVNWWILGPFQINLHLKWRSALFYGPGAFMILAKQGWKGHRAFLQSNSQTCLKAFTSCKWFSPERAMRWERHRPVSEPGGSNV